MENLDGEILPPFYTSFRFQFYSRVLLTLIAAACLIGIVFIAARGFESSASTFDFRLSGTESSPSVLTADPELIKALTALQNSQSNLARERWIGFGLGLTASLIASFIHQSISNYFWRRAVRKLD